MVSIIDRVFSRERRERAVFVSSELMSSDLEQYYQRIVSDCFKRMLVPPDAVEVEVRHSGTAPSGLPAYSAYVRLLRWDPALTPVILQNLPVIDGRVRSLANASVLLEHTHFAGVWIQAASTTPGAPRTLVGMAAELSVQPLGPA
jgi:hypothetical protein